VLNESLDYDLLRQDLIADGLSFDVVRVNNPWYYRQKGADTWVLIGESDDDENGFPVEWDISGLAPGRYEVMGQMQVFVAEGVSERAVGARQNIAVVTIQD